LSVVRRGFGTHASHDVSLDWLWLLATSKASFVDQVGEILLLQLFYLGNSLFETLFGGACNVEVKWGILEGAVSEQFEQRGALVTHGGSGQQLVGVVTSSSSDIFRGISFVM